jgi:hypothetical protein
VISAAPVDSSVGQRIRCPVCRRDGVEILSTPSGPRLAEHLLPIWYAVLPRRCPLSGAPFDKKAVA